MHIFRLYILFLILFVPCGGGNAVGSAVLPDEAVVSFGLCVPAGQVECVSGVYGFAQLRLRLHWAFLSLRLISFVQ